MLGSLGPVLGNCYKCNTPGRLYEFRPGFWICKGNSCWAEEVERERQTHRQQRQDVEDYRTLVAGTRI